MSLGRVLVTGGAGFIGSHLTEVLLARGATVRVLDALVPQVHGPERRRPSHLSAEVELLIGDVRDPDQIRRALDGVDAVIHLAARPGGGPSEIAECVDVDATGTARLLEALARRPVRRLVVASSHRVYGEGLYLDAHGRRADRAERRLDQIRAGDWDIPDADGRPLMPLPTPESKLANPVSVSGVVKHAEERLCRVAGAASRIPTVVLRLFDVYGPRRDTTHPHAGVVAAFAARLLQDAPPLLFEDGRQRRDFVHVSDVARACLLALESERLGAGVFNVASGESADLASVATRLAAAMGKSIEPVVTGRHRAGDARHCFADVSLARAILDYEPRVFLDEGLRDLAGSIGEPAHDRASVPAA